MEEKKISPVRSRPKGILVVSILNYIIAGLLIIVSLFSIFGGVYFITNGVEAAGQNALIELFPVSIDEPESFFQVFGAILIVMGVVILTLSVFAIVVGINLSKGKKWALISEYILLILWIIIWLFGLFGGPILNLIPIIPALIVLAYLILSKDSKSFFS